MSTLASNLVPSYLNDQRDDKENVLAHTSLVFLTLLALSGFGSLANAEHVLAEPEHA